MLFFVKDLLPFSKSFKTRFNRMNFLKLKHFFAVINLILIMDKRTVEVPPGNLFLFHKFDRRKTFRSGKIGEASLIDGEKTFPSFPGIFVAV